MHIYTIIIDCRLKLTFAVSLQLFLLAVSQILTASRLLFTAPKTTLICAQNKLVKMGIKNGTFAYVICISCNRDTVDEESVALIL
jgi:hypothetical protein